MIEVEPRLRVCFLFASRGIGGAERSMSRLMKAIHPDRANCHVIIVGALNEPFCEALDAMDVNYTHILTYDLLGLGRLLQELQTDVAYLFGNWRIILWAWIARLSHVPVVVAAERSIPIGHRIIGRRLDRHFVHGYICNSKAAQQILQNRCHISPQKIRVSYNGIYQEKYAWPVMSSTAEPTLLCIANIRPCKGQVVLLKAAKLLKEKYPDLKVNLVGSDLTDGAFFREIEALELHDIYTWFDFVSDVSPFLREADIFVLPSREREGTPTSILEAMLAGLPVVASDVGGIAELVQDGVTGFLVNPDDVEGLAQRLDQLLNSAEMRRQMSLAGRAHVLEHHTIEKMVESHLCFFQQLLEMNKARGDESSIG